MKYILSLDGGGIRGALTTTSLVQLESQTRMACRDIFSMVAGTSTGALIAAAIVAGMPAKQIQEIYSKRAGEIFNHSLPFAWGLRLSRGYAYDPENISRVLESEFGAAETWTLNSSPIPILLTAKGVDCHPWYFVPDNPHNSGRTGKLYLLDCAVASAAAPTYFAPWMVPTVGWCFDGGVGTTGNPAYQAAVEAFVYNTFYPATTRIISLGTGYSAGSAARPSGLAATLTWTLDALLSSPESEQTQLVRRHYPGTLQRFDWALPQAVNMADVSAIPGLIKLGQSSPLNWDQIIT